VYIFFESANLLTLPPAQDTYKHKVYQPKTMSTLLNLFLLLYF